MPKIGLKDVVIKTEKVMIDTEQDTWIEVRGISLADIIEMLKLYTDEMEALFRDFMDRRVEGQPVNVNLFTDLAMKALERTPDLIYSIIAVAAGEPDEVETIGNLRAPVQIEALAKILGLSITSEIELKKVVEGLTKSLGWAAALRRTLAPEMTDFVNGSSTAERPRPN